MEDVKKLGIQYHKLQIAETEIPTFEEISQQDQALFPILKRLILPRVRFDWSIIPHFFRTLFLLIKTKPDAVMMILPWPEYGLGSLLASSFLRKPGLVVFQLAPQALGIKNLKKKLYRWVRKRQKWVGVSMSNCRCISQSFDMPLEEIQCIYNGASFHTNSGLDKETIRSQIRKELGLSKDAQIAITVARLNSQKGHDFLIPAIPHLADEFPDLKFVWVGDGDKKDQLRDMLKKYDASDQVLFFRISF